MEVRATAQRSARARLRACVCGVCVCTRVRTASLWHGKGGLQLEHAELHAAGGHEVPARPVGADAVAVAALRVAAVAGALRQRHDEAVGPARVPWQRHAQLQLRRQPVGQRVRRRERRVLDKRKAYVCTQPGHAACRVMQPSGPAHIARDAGAGPNSVRRRKRAHLRARRRPRGRQAHAVVLTAGALCAGGAVASNAAHVRAVQAARARAPSAQQTEHTPQQAARGAAVRACTRLAASALC
jgi:hypothetical protein